MRQLQRKVRGETRLQRRRRDITQFLGVWTLLAGPNTNTALLRAIMRKHHEEVMGALP